MDDVPITRDIARLHVFSIHIQNPSEYDIVSLENTDLYNFKVQYLFSKDSLANMAAMEQSNDTYAVELYQSGAARSSTSTLLISAEFNLNLTACEELTFLCVAILDVPLGSWKDSNPSNNMICADITQFVICHPGWN